MALKVHLIVDEVLGGTGATITIRPASGKIGKFWYAKASGTGADPTLTFIGETGNKQLATDMGAFEFGEAIFGEATNYQKFEIAIDYNNYITITTTSGADGYYSVYWVES